MKTQPLYGDADDYVSSVRAATAKTIAETIAVLMDLGFRISTVSVGDAIRHADITRLEVAGP